MDDIDAYIKELDDLDEDFNNIIGDCTKEIKEMNRLEKLIVDTPKILNDIDKEFERMTKLTKTDVKILFLAIGLQLARQFVLSDNNFRLTSIQGDKLMENTLKLTPPKWQDVLLQSVPYDAIRLGDHIKDSIGISGTTHRFRTLGHDPVLGWIFGTANIMTNSLTKNDFETFQVKDMIIIRHYPLGTTGMLEKAVKYGIDDPLLFASSVARQAIHFGSDYFTNQGLPIPVISTVNDSLAKKMMTRFHIDMFGITRNIVASVAIDKLIMLIHQLYYDEKTEDKDLYIVRAKKIISIANGATAVGNIAYVAATKAFRKLDLAGIVKAIYVLIKNDNFIRKVKEDYINEKYRDIVFGN